MSNKNQSNKGLLSVTFALEVIIDGAGIKNYILREPRAMQPISMTTESSVVLDALDEAVKAFQNLSTGVRQG